MNFGWEGTDEYENNKCKVKDDFSVHIASRKTYTIKTIAACVFHLRFHSVP